MNRIYRLALLGVSLTLALFSPASALCQQEPVYTGKTVSEWVTQLGPKNPVNERRQAIEAIGQLGSNALPSLLLELRELVRVYSTNPAFFAAPFTNEASMRLQSLVQAFRAIGENARPAAPELANLFNRGLLTDFVSMMLTDADRNLAETTFVHALTNQSIEVRLCAIPCMIRHPGPTNAAAELAGLISCLNDETPETNRVSGRSNGDLLRARAARALGTESGVIDPKRAVLALIDRLQREKSPWVRSDIFYAFGRLGANARYALPALRQATNDPIRYVAEQAVESLKAVESVSP